MIGNEVTGMEALTVTVFSMGLVFLTLFAISLMLDIFKIGHENQKKQNKEQTTQKSIIEDKPEEEKEDKEELIAVITAALMEKLNTTEDKLIIRNIKQIKDTTWAQTGRIENMN